MANKVKTQMKKYTFWPLKILEKGGSCCVFPIYFEKAIFLTLLRE